MFLGDIIGHLSQEEIVDFSKKFNSLFPAVMLNKRNTQIISNVAIKEVAIGLIIAARSNLVHNNILKEWKNHNVREDRINDSLASASILVECFMRRFVRIKYDDSLQCYGLFAQNYLAASNESISSLYYQWERTIECWNRDQFNGSSLNKWSQC
jgi:hypothetical protein